MHLGHVGGCCDPETGDPVAYRFDDRYFEIRKRGPSPVIADVITLAQVLKCPDRVFKGLKRPGMQQALAFLGRPRERYLLGPDGEPFSVPVEGKELFFVYVREHYCIYHHAWVDLDFERPGLPADQAEDDYVTMCFDKEITYVRRI